MHRVIRIFTVFGAALLLMLAPARAGNTTFNDGDWNTDFVESCGFPRPHSIQQTRVGSDTKLKVTLYPGDVGKCSTDNQARHRAPYWERAEVSQSTSFQIGQRYQISTEITLLEGFAGERETFFQIHGWAHGCPKAYPPVMVKFKSGKLHIETLRGVTAFSSGRHRNVLKHRVMAHSLYGKPTRLELDFDLRLRPALLSVRLAGELIVKDAPVAYAPCAVPHLKFGIYRPGGKGSSKSVLLFDDVIIESTD